jgi:hypothetical protein
MAALKGHIAVVEKLLQAQAEVNHTDEVRFLEPDPWHGRYLVNAKYLMDIAGMRVPARAYARVYACVCIMYACMCVH